MTDFSDCNVSEHEKFEALFHEIPAALALLRGANLIFEKANQEFYSLVGRSDVIGKPLVQAIPELAEQRFPALMEAVFVSGRTYQAREVELHFRKDGQDPGSLGQFYVDLTYRRIHDNYGNPYGIFMFAVDVTEKVQSRQNVRREQMKLEAVFANASAPIAILEGAHFVFEQVNDSYLNLFSKRALIGKPILDALPELEGQKFIDLLVNVFSTGELYIESEAKAYLRRTDQGALEERFFDQSYARITDDDGRPYGVLIYAVDVTERVNSRRQLAENAERFRIAIEGANMGTWDVNLQTGWVDWSERSAELFGFDPAEKVRVDDVITHIHPEDRERMQQAMAEATDPRGNGNYHIEYRIHTGGRLRWIALRGKTFFVETPQGKVPHRFSGVVLDVTERALSEQALRRSEQQFRTMAAVMPQVVWTAKPDGTLDYINERWHQFADSTNPEAWMSHVHPEDFESAAQTWAQSVGAGDVYDIEFRLRDKDNNYRWFLVRAHPSYASTGKIERWIGTCTDIEEQKAALNLRNEFMSIASHELKTPLTSLKLQTQAMRRNFERGRAEAFSLTKVKDLVDNNEKQVGRLIRLVDDMLDFAKIDSGKLSIVREDTDLCALVGDVFSRLKEQLENAGCEIRLAHGDEAHAWVDRFRIEQVVTNLLTNAVRYGRGKPVSINVNASPEQAVITVADAGMGIAQENIERIFKRFERAVSANEISGLGLGLYITREIVEAHQGKISVESELGVGSTFKVELPVGKPDEL